MRLLTRTLAWMVVISAKLWSRRRGRLQVDTEMMRRRRELARSENQAGHNLTVQTTIDMARTQTWTGGG